MGGLQGAAYAKQGLSRTHPQICESLAIVNFLSPAGTLINADFPSATLQIISENPSPALNSGVLLLRSLHERVAFLRNRFEVKTVSPVLKEGRLF